MLFAYKCSSAKCGDDSSTTYHSIAYILSMLSVSVDLSNVAVVEILKNVSICTWIFK